MDSDDDYGPIASALEFIVVRVLWFIGSFIALGGFAFIGAFGGSGRRGRASYDESLMELFFTPGLWILLALLSLAFALIGPPLYHRHTMRGRGSLKDIKEDGRYDGD